MALAAEAPTPGRRHLRMHLKERTLDDLLRSACEALRKSKLRVNANRGNNTELTGVLLHLTHPRARLSRTETRSTLFSALGELLWYLSGADELEFIEYYIPFYRKESKDGKTVHDAYGPRLFHQRGVDQVTEVISLLRRHPDSRRAVVQLYNAEDLLTPDKPVPCTCTLQFLVRDGRLETVTHMRSNDVYKGLPHDVFCFTMLQEIVARSLGIDVGEYRQFVGSLHLYDDDSADVEQFMREGWQSFATMPPMPDGDPWPPLRALQRAEGLIRRGEDVKIDDLPAAPYWQDMVRLLEIRRSLRQKDEAAVARLKGEMSSDVYDPFIDYRVSTQIRRPTKRPTRQEQLPLPPAAGGRAAP